MTAQQDSAECQQQLGCFGFDWSSFIRVMSPVCRKPNIELPKDKAFLLLAERPFHNLSPRQPIEQKMPSVVDITIVLIYIRMNLIFAGLIKCDLPHLSLLRRFNLSF